MNKIAVLQIRGILRAYHETLTEFYKEIHQPIPRDLMNRCYQLVKLNVEEILSTRSAFACYRDITVDGSQIIYGRLTGPHEQKVFMRLQNTHLLAMLYKQLQEQIAGIVPAHSWSIWSVLDHMNTLFIVEQVAYNVDEQINSNNDLSLEIDLSSLFRVISVALSYQNIYVEPMRFKWLFLRELQVSYPQLKIDNAVAVTLVPKADMVCERYFKPVIEHLGLRYFNYTGYEYYYHCTIDDFGILTCTRTTMENIINKHIDINDLIDSYQRGDFLLPTERVMVEKYIQRNPEEFYY